jgi:hypothetical protein
VSLGDIWNWIQSLEVWHLVAIIILGILVSVLLVIFYKKIGWIE